MDETNLKEQGISCKEDISTHSVRPDRSKWYTLLATICLAGTQFTWTVQFSRGTSYLSRLNLPDNIAVLTLLAGPISGILIQPIVGAISDKCTFKFGKRRPFVIFGSILVCLSMLGIAFSKEIGGDASRFLPSQDEKMKFSGVTIAIAIFSFYVLNSSLYIVQSSCRSLIIDVHPIHQQARANAFAGNIISITNATGYLIGSIDLVNIFPYIVNAGDQDAQLKIFCFISLAVFFITTSITCISIKEQPMASNHCHQSSKSTCYLVVIIKYMWQAIRRLPRSIRKLCLVQFFASLAWFPSLFYSASWITGISSLSLSDNPEQQLTFKDLDHSERVASFGLLINSIVAIGLGIFFPWIVSKNWISIKNIFTFSLAVLSLTLMSTYFVKSNDVKSTYIIMAIVGIASACSTWIPFTLIGKYIEIEKLKLFRNDSGVSTMISSDDTDTQAVEAVEIEETSKTPPNQPLDSGMMLVVYNFSIVIPHLIMILVSSLIFAAVNKGQGDTRARVTGIGWVLQLGGLMTIFAVILSRRIDNV